MGEKALWDTIKEFGGVIFTNWLFTEKGTAAIALLWGAIMAALTYFTHSLDIFAPLSYGLLASLGIILGLHVCRLANSTFSQRFTKKPTFVEYKMEKGRINLVKKSNIFGEPAARLNIQLVQDKPQMIASNPRNKRRLDKKNASLTLKEHDSKSLSVLVIFDRPLANSDFHVHIVGLGGTCPTREASDINSRVSTVALSNVSNDCSFQIWFNERKNKS